MIAKHSPSHPPAPARSSAASELPSASRCHGVQPIIVLALVLLTAPASHAVDGVIELSHVRALAGGVTTSDTPGYPITIDNLGKGSYRLTSNLQVTDANTFAIIANADDVTIDLNGFTITGPTTCTWTGTTPECTGTGSGSGILAFKPGFVLSGGTIRGMGHHGVEAHENARIENVSVVGNGGGGVICLGACIVDRVEAHINGGSGLHLAVGARVTNTIGRRNVTGLTIFGGSVAGVTATENASHGIFAGGGPSVIVQSRASNNGTYGLWAVHDGTGYSQNVFSDNGTADVLGGLPLGDNICTDSYC